MLYPYSFGIMIKEIFQVTIFYTIDHYHRMDKNVVFEGRMVFGGHIPVQTEIDDIKCYVQTKSRNYKIE